MTPKQLQVLTQLWQKRLRIQDWTIKVRVVSLAEMLEIASPSTLGLCECAGHKKKAWISVMRGEDIPGDEDCFEAILVHELLHVAMPIQDLDIARDHDNPAHIAYERVIDQMTQSFMEAYGGDNT